MLMSVFKQILKIKDLMLWVMLNIKLVLCWKLNVLLCCAIQHVVMCFSMTYDTNNFTGRILSDGGQW